MCLILKTTFQLINNLYINCCDKKQSGDVELDSALMTQDLKDVETLLVVKYADIDLYTVCRSSFWLYWGLSQNKNLHF